MRIDHFDEDHIDDDTHLDSVMMLIVLINQSPFSIYTSILYIYISLSLSICKFDWLSGMDPLYMKLLGVVFFPPSTPVSEPWWPLGVLMVVPDLKAFRWPFPTFLTFGRGMPKAPGTRRKAGAGVLSLKKCVNLKPSIYSGYMIAIVFESLVLIDPSSFALYIYIYICIRNPWSTLLCWPKHGSTGSTSFFSLVYPVQA